MHSPRTRQAEDIPADLQALIRIGTIVEVDLENARCRVRYGDPTDEDPGETPPIRWLAARAGATRTWSPPTLGEQVILLAPDGQIGAGVAMPGLVRDAFPPVGNSEAEMIEFADGARITYDPQTGALSAILPAGATAEIEAPGGITLRGDVRIEGKLTVTDDAQVDKTLTADKDVIGGGKSLKGHLHKGVTGGSALSGPPN